MDIIDFGSMWSPSLEWNPALWMGAVGSLEAGMSLCHGTPHHILGFHGVDFLNRDK
jgi:hypothetical protein